MAMLNKMIAYREGLKTCLDYFEKESDFQNIKTWIINDIASVNDTLETYEDDIGKGLKTYIESV